MARTRWRLGRLFLPHMRQVRPRLLVAALCSLGVAGTELLKPWPLKLIIDHGITNHPLPPALHFLQAVRDHSRVAFLLETSGAIIVIALAAALFAYLQVFITSSVGYSMVYALRRELFAHLQRLSLSFHNRARSGDLMTRIAGDTTELRNVVTEHLLRFASDFLTVVGMCVVMVAVNWRVSLIVLATLPCLGYSLFHLYRKTKSSVRTQRAQEGQVASRMSEVLSAIPLVQAFARERHEEERFDAVTAETLKESVRIARLEAAATRSSEIITAVGTAAALLFGALEVLRGAMLPGELVLVSAYMASLYNPIKGLAKVSTKVSKAMASAERIMEVLEIAPEIQDAPDAVEAGRLRGEIAFERVSFDYGDGRDVLRDVSFTVAPGQRLALLGPSGAGKSTIVSLILRLYETQHGRIRIDGMEIQRFTRESLRREIGLVLQQSILFGATVSENIAYGNPAATPEQIVAAARAANADEFIRELEDGYDTVIGERGATLSGGQRQRIAIARALIRDAPILILDEPMTGLDVESEAKVREALDRLMAGKTCVLITHDLQSVAGADQVLMLEEGRILERGSHAELLATSRRYRRLYEMDQRPEPAAART